MNLRAYWTNLNEREQLSLSVAVVVCIIYLFYLLVYAPLTSAVAVKTQQLQEKRDTLAWMQKMDNQYRSVNKTTQQSITSSKLLSLIALELSKPAFVGFTYQLQQMGSGDIQLNFEEVPYTIFINWLWKITHQYQIHIKQLRVERIATPGLVKLNLLLYT